jgi:glycosyltransferase involved in cell wall biosynthesis
MNSFDYSANPTVSVIMPCFNHGEFLEESASSILSQSLSNLELIIIDDCSSDRSKEVVAMLSNKDSRVRYIFHAKNLGASRSRNDGLAVARGTYVAFCDADDLWMPEKLAEQVALLEESQSYGLAYCDAEIIDGRGVSKQSRFSCMFRPPHNPSGWLFDELINTNFINTQTVIIRRDVLRESDGFDEKIRWVEDWWLWLQLSRRTMFFYDARVLAKYRVHEKSTFFSQAPGIIRNRFKVLKRNLRVHADMPLSLKGEIWYSIGQQLKTMGRDRRGTACMRLGFFYAVRGRAPIKRLLRMFARVMYATIAAWCKLRR